MRHSNTNHRYNYSVRRGRRYPYPNEAEPGYFAGRILDGLTALVTGMGAITLLVYFLTL